MERLNYPMIAEIAYHTYAIDEFGMAAFYILWGTERGLVIDLGCGSFDAKSLIDTLCPVPYDVILTHGHGDHVGAMSQFDKVWLHPADYDRISDLDRMKEMLWENPAVHNSTLARGQKNVTINEKKWDYPYLHLAAKEMYELSEDMFMGFPRVPEFLPLKDGQLFDLGGGRVCEIVYTPGHTAGSCSVIDPVSRILFSGDACNSFLGISGSSINSELTGLLKLKKKQSQFDRNFNGHTGANGNPFCFSMPESTLDDCIWICRHILDGTAPVETLPARHMPTKAVPAGFKIKPGRCTHGCVTINFNQERLIDEGETPAE